MAAMFVLFMLCCVAVVAMLATHYDGKAQRAERERDLAFAERDALAAACRAVTKERDEARDEIEGLTHQRDVFGRGMDQANERAATLRGLIRDAHQGALKV